MAEVLCVGMAVADFVFRVRAIPSRAEKYRAQSLETVVGGPAANAAIAVARLGGRAVLVTRLGEDAIADTVRAGLEAEGVACRIRRRGRSPVSAAAIDAAGERQVVNFPGEALVEAPGTLDDTAPSAVLVDAHWTEAALAALALARSRGVPGVVDAEAPAAESVLEAASHVAFSRSGLAAFTGIGDKEAALPGRGPESGHLGLRHRRGGRRELRRGGSREDGFELPGPCRRHTGRGRRLARRVHASPRRRYRRARSRPLRQRGGGAKMHRIRRRPGEPRQDRGRAAAGEVALGPTRRVAPFPGARASCPQRAEGP